ncbi:MAG TPA: transglutaminase domain-containing protein [Pyrinomonadaceae bacterium]|nr:transglutaminase domain-containing protein [Pyrinomonadaceae bacterium]
MRKLSLIVIFWCCCVVSAPAQQTPAQTREAEWKAYALPQVNFVRQKDTDNNIVFRVPADWKQETSMSFVGPHSAAIHVYVQQIPDGYSLQEYFVSFLQVVRDRAGAAESTLTRRTQIQDLDAREIFFETTTADGETLRSVSWMAVSGPLAVTVHFQAPVAHATELEPLFKAVVQSVIFLPLDHVRFESLRTSVFKSAAPGPINEIESIVSSLNEIGVDREPAITRLTTLFSSQPDTAVDLLVDRRPLLRGAAVEALVRSNNSSLSPFLWLLVDDKDPLVAEVAARVVATKTDVIEEIIERSMYGHRVELIARVWPFMLKDKRLELLQRVFSQTATRNTDPPPPVRQGAKPDVTVTVKELRAVKPGEPPPPVTRNFSNDPNVQIGALTLLIDVPREEFKLPLERIIASNNDELIALALQVANLRGESLAIEPLLKLVKSSDQQISKSAAQCLSLSAGVADIPRIEALLSNDPADAKKALDDELKISIRKIRFRQEIGNTKNRDEWRPIIAKAFVDPALADFAWRYDCESTTAGCSPNDAVKRDVTVKPFAENLFPKKVRHYITIPKPGEAIEKFYETMAGLQLDSARSQVNLVLVLNGMRQVLAQQLNAPADAPSLLEYTGIDASSPIAFGSWTPDKIADSVTTAQRRAIVLRVKDRARFERFVQQLQGSTGPLTYMTDYLAVGTRGIAALPAFLPFSAQALATAEPSKSKKPVRRTYSLIGDKEWNGLHVRTMEQRRLNSEGQFENYITYLTFIGNTAILTIDLATLRDLLSNDAHANLADNAEFRKAVEQRGDVVYFSDLKSIFAEASPAGKSFDFNINESGVLNIGNASWENTHHLAFAESDWTKPLLPFHPRGLASPRDLLPASTIAYYLMNVDLKLGWSNKIRTSVFPNETDTTSLWSLNFADEVLPELGPECGAAVVELPSLDDLQGGKWAAFCKLKSNKLSDALNEGKLFKNVGPTKDFAQIKTGGSTYFVAARNGFLVIANSEEAIAAFDGKSSLAATRDYARAVEKVPGNVLAFGGYNLEAAIAAARKTEGEGLNGQIANIIFSIASAFHSQNFYATATSGTIEAHSSVSMDREGRYSVSDFSELSKGGNVTFATIEPAGLPIADQSRLSSLLLRVKAKAAGPIDSVRDDIKNSDQAVEQKSATELLLRVAARRSVADKTVVLPVKDAEFAPYVKATAEFSADDEQVKKQAREIAGDDRDAWSVARKLADWTHQNLEWKAVSSADARQTLATREADCSEFSALFVAMARSLGLPARLVSGLAYSNNAFGGHAWVEVWAGKWIELDPTWGTHFVDATHIRNESGALVTSAALNLIELEVLEARRSVTDFQQSPKALAQHLLKAIPAANRSDIEAVLDLGVLTDELMGAGTWSRMTDAEHNQMSSAYRRVMHEIIDGYGRKEPAAKMRLLHLEEKGNTAEAICLLGPNDQLLKLRFVRRDDIWYLVEIIQTDTDLYTVAESVQPTIATIENARAGRKEIAGPTDVTRVLILIQSDAAKALAIAENALKTKPSDRTLRFLKALALQNMNKTDEAVKLLRELSGENFAPAVYRLASQLNHSEDEKQRTESITFYKRYTELEPLDSRGFRDLAIVTDGEEKLAEAEAAYRKVIELNPADVDGYLSLIQFLVVHKRIADVRPVLLAAEKLKDIDVDVFGAAMQTLTHEVEIELIEPFVASEPSRMKTSYLANQALGNLYSVEERFPEALRLLHVAAQLDKTASAPHAGIAYIYRWQRRLSLALRAAQQAVALDDNDGDAYYELACALAQLRRTKEAMTALEKAIELDPEQAHWIATEPDLKPLAQLPAFKKLVPPPEKK